MNLPRRRFNVAAAAGLLLGAALTVRAAPPPESGALVFGVISPRSAEQTRANWLPFVKRMGADVGQATDLRVYESQAQMVKAFVAGEVDVGWMGNAPALEVVESGAGSVFAQMVTKEGSFGYKSVLVVNQNAKMATLGDLLAQAQNLRFSDGEPKSTSGFLVPLYFAFQKSGINDTKLIFKAYSYASHQENLKKVAQGEVDVATANTEEVAFFTRDFPQLGPRLKVVWESPLIPQSPLVWRNTLPPEAKRRIKNFVVNFGSGGAQEKQILEAVNSLSRFRPSSNLQLVPIADLEMFKARQAINNDGKLSPSERTQRIDEVIRRGSRIEMRLKLAPG